MTKTLYLHIGAHKTGSSAIQIACHNNLDALRAQGWDFAFEPGQPLNWGQCFRYGPQGPDVRFKFDPKWMTQLRNRLSPTDAHTVILSMEDLFFLDGVDIENFCAMIADLFDEVHVVAYLRRQDELANSQKAQSAKTVQSARLFGLEADPLPSLTPAVRRYLSFASKLAQWQQALPDAQIHLRHYHRPALHQGDAAADFFDLLGLNLPWQVGRINESLGAMPIRLLLNIRQVGVKNVRLADLVDNGWPSDDPTPFLPTRSQAAAFLTTFSAENDKLVELFPNFESFHQGFDRYPRRSKATEIKESTFRHYVETNLTPLTESPAPPPLTPEVQTELRPALDAILADLPKPEKSVARHLRNWLPNRKKQTLIGPMRSNSQPHKDCKTS